MRIATFNANSIRARLDTVLGWLQAHEPEVLCIQETKVQDHEFPEAPLREAGYHVCFKGQKSYNGVAVISKDAPTEVRAGFDDGDPADETRLLCARMGPLWVVNTYVPQGRATDHEMFQYKQEWFRRLRAYFDRLFTKDDLVVWLGDINVAQEAIDVHNPKERANHVCYHEDARRAFADCRAWGFVDVFRKHHPEPGHYTFFDYRTQQAVQRGLGWRIDYILASPALAEKSTDSYIDLEPRLSAKPSDHVPLVADFAK